MQKEICYVVRNKNTSISDLRISPFTSFSFAARSKHAPAHNFRVCFVTMFRRISFSKYTYAIATVSKSMPYSSLAIFLISRFKLKREFVKVNSGVQGYDLHINCTYLRNLLRVSWMCGNFSLNLSFNSFFRSEGLT